MKKIILKFFEFFGLKILKKKTFDKYLKNSNKLINLDLLKNVNNIENIRLFLKYLDKSKSQSQRVAMDLFILLHLNFKKKGYFVEFGGGNGVINSNTHLMEKEFGWNGIISEPGKVYYPDILNNRNCHVEKLCVWSKNDAELTLVEAPKEIDPGMSSILDYAYDDKFAYVRKKGKKYQVRSITLIDLLKKYNAPKIIDYISIDTEGSEYEILKNFDFSEYKFNFITCEHMFIKKKRDDIYDLLTKNGYKRISEDLSLQDDWYIPEN